MNTRHPVEFVYPGVRPIILRRSEEQIWFVEYLLPETTTMIKYCNASRCACNHPRFKEWMSQTGITPRWRAWWRQIHLYQCVATGGTDLCMVLAVERFRAGTVVLPPSGPAAQQQFVRALVASAIVGPGRVVDNWLEPYYQKDALVRLKGVDRAYVPRLIEMRDNVLLFSRGTTQWDKYQWLRRNVFRLMGKLDLPLVLHPLIFDYYCAHDSYRLYP
jgi:hypothetical protein